MDSQMLFDGLPAEDYESYDEQPMPIIKRAWFWAAVGAVVVVAVIIALVVHGLSNKPVIPPEPVPSMSPPVTVVVTETVTPTRVTPSTPQPPVATFALVCTAPSDYVVQTYPYANSIANPPDKTEMVLVEIGEGNTAGSDWWAVAALTPNWATEWITDAQSGSGTTWIQVDNDSSTGWSSVHWSDERLARGWTAVDTAVNCLNQRYR